MSKNTDHDAIQKAIAEGKKLGSKFVQVTTTRIYEIHKGYYQDDLNPLLSEWFEKFSPLASHAFRDGSLFVEYFNEDSKII